MITIKHEVKDSNDHFYRDGVEVGLPLMMQFIVLGRINDYISDEAWAEHNGLSLEHAQRLLELCRDVHEARVANPQ